MTSKVIKSDKVRKGIFVTHIPWGISDKGTNVGKDRH